MPPKLALWLTLISLNYPCLEHIFMVIKVFKPLKFYCILNRWWSEKLCIDVNDMVWHILLALWYRKPTLAYTTMYDFKWLRHMFLLTYLGLHNYCVTETLFRSHTHFWDICKQCRHNSDTANVASDQGLPCLHTRHSMQNKVKVKYPKVLKYWDT